MINYMQHFLVVPFNCHENSAEENHLILTSTSIPHLSLLELCCLTKSNLHGIFEAKVVVQLSAGCVSQRSMPDTATHSTQRSSPYNRVMPITARLKLTKVFEVELRL